MANLIQIKRSETTAIPAALANGEAAWSGNSKVLYIGANGVVEAIGGRRYPGVLTANQAITTNATGMIDVIRYGNSTVNAVVNSLALTISNSTVTFSIIKPTAAQVSDGDWYLASDGAWKQVTPGAPSTTLNDLTDVVISSASNNQLLIYDEAASVWENHSFGNGFSFAGHSPAILALNGIVANTTGIHAVGANGIAVTSAGINMAPGTDGGLVSNTTGAWVKAANGISLSSDGVNVRAGTNGGLVANSTGVWVVAGSTLTVNSTGVHVNSALSIQDLTLAGNLVVQGSVVTVDATNLAVNDSIISLARNNGADSLDIGFFGQYNDGTERFTGLVWDTSADVFELFANSTVEPTTTVDTAATGYVRATLRSYLNTGALISNTIAVTITANSTHAVNFVANTLTLTTPLNGPSGGVGLSTYTAEDILVANSTNGFRKLSVGAEGKVMTVSSGVVAWTDLDGGSF